MNVTGELGGDLPLAGGQPGLRDSAATEKNRPGTYRAGVGIGHDTPYYVPAVGVEMVATPPKN